MVDPDDRPKNLRDEREELERDPETEGSEELSAEERAAALGRPFPRWLAMGLGIAAVLGVAFLLWRFDSAIKMERLADSLAVAEAQEGARQQIPVPDTIHKPFEAGQVTTSAEQPGDTTTPAPGQMTVSPVVATALDTTLLSLSDTAQPLDQRSQINDQFYLLLNAQVSDTETAAMEDTEFVRMLFTPLITGAGLPIPISVPYAAPGELAGVGMAAGAPWDSTRYLLVIDSLRSELAVYHEQFAKVQPETTAALIGAKPEVLTAADTARIAEIKKLAKILESMDPKAAAVMLNGRSSDELRAVLFKVKPRVAAKIVENLPAGKRDEFAEFIVHR